MKLYISNVRNHTNKQFLCICICVSTILEMVEGNSVTVRYYNTEHLATHIQHVFLLVKFRGPQKGLSGP